MGSETRLETLKRSEILADLRAEIEELKKRVTELESEAEPEPEDIPPLWVPQGWHRERFHG